MTTTTGQAPGVQVTAVDFEVSTYHPMERVDSFAEAVKRARATIERFEYRGQVMNKQSPDYHPRRVFQEEDVLVHYSRAFVNLRVVEPIQDRPGKMRSGIDRVACTWEVFRDGTVETFGGFTDG
jgi:hypothetical protein